MDDFNFIFNSDDEDEIQIEKKVEEFKPIVNVTNKVYKTVLPFSQNVTQYASESLNCVHSIKSSWRMTQFIPKLTLNFFKNCNGVCMVMTKELDDQVVSDLINEYLGHRPLSMKTINITLIIKLNRLINIDQLFQVGKQIVNHEIHMFIDKQRYPAIIIRPCPKRRIVMEIFRTGMVNLTGLNKKRRDR